jgi:hypothetical protein
MELYDIQTVISFIVTSIVVGLGIYYPWASKEALIPSLSLLVCYNIVDMIIGFKGYIKNDIATLFHHIVVLSGTYTILHIIQNNYTHDMYRLTRWGMIAEVTSWCNNIRILTRNTPFKSIISFLFGIVFLIGRAVMSIGLYYDMHNNKYFFVLLPFCISLIILNMHWSELIINKIMNNKVESPKIYSLCAKYQSFVVPYIAIYAHEKYNNYLTTLLWIYFTISITTFYNINLYVSMGMCLSLIVLQFAIM